MENFITRLVGVCSRENVSYLKTNVSLTELFHRSRMCPLLLPSPVRLRARRTPPLHPPSREPAILCAQPAPQQRSRACVGDPVTLRADDVRSRHRRSSHDHNLLRSGCDRSATISRGWLAVARTAACGHSRPASGWVYVCRQAARRPSRFNCRCCADGHSNLMRRGAASEGRGWRLRVRPSGGACESFVRGRM